LTWPLIDFWINWAVTIKMLAGQILSAKAKDPEADASAIERQIDQLYGLTPEEIAVVEAKK